MPISDPTFLPCHPPAMPPIAEPIIEPKLPPVTAPDPVYVPQLLNMSMVPNDNTNVFFIINRLFFVQRCKGKHFF
jgi:hypothetical protein